MSDLGIIEKRTIYQIPEGEDLYLPYVGSDPWPERTVTIHGDMLPVEQQAIPWCTFHRRPLGTGAGGGDFNPMDETCAHPPENVPMPEIYDCVISTGGPEHKWWVDV